MGYRASLVETTLKKPGVDLPGPLSDFMIFGMDCADCAVNVEKRLVKLGGVMDATVNFSTSEQQELGRTAMLVSDESNVIGLNAVADVVREESTTAIRLLKQSGINHSIMLSGDNERTAKAVRAQVGVDEHYGEMLPDQKLVRIEQLKDR
ncbi:HAD family hydrolase [Effusibacillus consociatus]|uniref:HAD family hydrolase n=1 Tax=Effusibacillus consociatus TaxID=1117041 RepID=A0ABV9Q5Z5_9BACL